MKPWLLLSCALLTGCTLFDEMPPPLEEPPHDTAILVIYKRDPSMRKDWNGWARFGFTTNKDKLPQNIRTCHISTRNYPKELGHEMAHCFNGNFHGTPETDHYKYYIWK